MARITRERAAQAAQDYKVSEQNREVWEAGYIAGFKKGRAVAYAIVVESCAECSASIEVVIKNETSEE